MRSTLTKHRTVNRDHPQDHELLSIPSYLQSHRNQKHTNQFRANKETTSSPKVGSDLHPAEETPVFGLAIGFLFFVVLRRIAHQVSERVSRTDDGPFENRNTQNRIAASTGSSPGLVASSFGWRTGRAALDGVVSIFSCYRLRFEMKSQPTSSEQSLRTVR